jgi:peptide/nickel transport system substrate-binding protein
MLQKRFMVVVGMLVAISMVLAACGTATPATPTTAPVVATAAPTTTRHGGWLDEIDYSVVDGESAVSQIQAGAIDIYTYGLASTKLPDIQAAGLSYASFYGTYYDIMFNPAVFTDATRLNPFSNHKIREAVNWLIDRNYVNQEIYGGGALAKFTPLTTQLVDYTGVIDVARGIEALYAYNPDRAKDVIATEMAGMGATMGSDGKWQFNGADINVEFLIRIDGDGTRHPMGDYVATQLESVGFSVTRHYGKSSELSPFWIRSDPFDGQWNVYTAGWGSSGLARDESASFNQMYTPNSVQGLPVFTANTTIDPAFQAVSDKLIQGTFTTLAERHDLFVQALPLALQDSTQVWVVDTLQFDPYQPNVSVTYDVGAGIEAARMPPYTIRFKDQEGGQMKVGTSDMFTDPWNPVLGSNWIWDAGIQNTTRGAAFMPDPYTGLAWPLRAASAAVTVQTGLPVSKTLDWVSLDTADTIAVPGDAWADWDAVTQRFVTVAGKIAKLNASIPLLQSQLADALAAEAAAGPAPAPAEGEEAAPLLSETLTAQLATAQDSLAKADTAKAKVVVTFPADLFTTVKWHDGSNLSVADFIMAFIMGFDPAKAESRIFDPAQAAVLESFLSYFKGYRIDSTDPLVVEFYTDQVYPDAELIATSVTIWPIYSGNGSGEAAWDMIAVANDAEANGELAYSTDKSGANSVEWTSFVGGPSLDILSAHLDSLMANSTIPYAPTMGAYVTADEAAARYANLKAWYTAHGHFWVGTGPYYLDSVDTTAKSAVVKQFADFPDLSDRWAAFSSPKLADAALAGPSTVSIGQDAAFTATITVQETGDAYPVDEVKQVKFLVYDATGATVYVGEGVSNGDSTYTLTIPADVTSTLEAGSGRIEVAAVLGPVAIPAFTTLDYVVQ